jgi:uncharacterized membrane protein
MLIPRQELDDRSGKFNTSEDVTVNLAPLLDASLAIQIHVATIVPAAILGPCVFLSRKGTPRHRFLGRIWLGLMVAAALSSFFIHTIDLFLGFSPIHLLSVYVLYGSWAAIRAARARRIREHRLTIIGMYVGGIVIAGGFTLLPGRIMNEMLLTYPAEWPDATRLFAFLAIMAGSILVIGTLSALAARPRAAMIGRSTS